MPEEKSVIAEDSGEVCGNYSRDFVIVLTVLLVNGGPRGRSGGDHAPDHRVEPLLVDGERSGNRGTHRDLDRDHDVSIHRLDNPAESSKRHVPAAVPWILHAIDGEQDLLEHGLDIELHGLSPVGPLRGTFF